VVNSDLMNSQYSVYILVITNSGGQCVYVSFTAQLWYIKLRLQFMFLSVGLFTLLDLIKMLIVCLVISVFLCYFYYYRKFLRDWIWWPTKSDWSWKNATWRHEVYLYSVWQTVYNERTFNCSQKKTQWRQYVFLYSVWEMFFISD